MKQVFKGIARLLETLSIADPLKIYIVAHLQILIQYKRDIIKNNQTDLLISLTSHK